MTRGVPGDLDDITRRYLARLPTAPPPDLGGSEWTPLIDGSEYFPALAEAIDDTEPGDCLFVLGLQLDPDVDLRGHSRESAEWSPIGMVLAKAAGRGVDVRIILAGSVFTGGMPFRVGPFVGNVAAARELRSIRTPEDDGAPPLQHRVLLDWSGHRLGSNHQKAIVITRRGTLEAYVGGIDVAAGRGDGPPHVQMRRGDTPWGWHDAAQRLRGPVAQGVWEVARERWREAASLPARPAWYRGAGIGRLNPMPVPPDPGPAPDVPGAGERDQAIQILRSYGRWKQHPPPPAPRRPWAHIPAEGVQEVFHALAHAIDAARDYVYVEDQYFREYPGGDQRFELYGHLRDAAARGVRLLLIGSGVRRPDDVRGGLANRELPPDIRRKVVDPLPEATRTNVAFFRVEGVTVHAKVVLVDDRFACIGSANIFSRSMVGTDHELSVAVVDGGTAVRDLRVRLWADHMRIPDSDHTDRAQIVDLASGLGAWRAAWAQPGAEIAPVGPPLVLVGP
jgi:phosphatidylserine/phosphatidylglycerophosphate/cardiolipin synthase-like enzyme